MAKCVLAVFPLDVKRAESYGLVEKAQGLIRAGREEGIAVDAVFSAGRTHWWWRDQEEVSWPIPGHAGGLRESGFRYRGFWKKLPVDPTRYHTVWLRAHPPSSAQLTWLRAIRATEIRIVVDIPTYPSAIHSASWMQWLQRMVQPPTASLKLADRIVTISDHQEIAGVKCLHVENGISRQLLDSLASIADQRQARILDPSNIHFVGFGQWVDYHGVDRLIHFLSQHRIGRITLGGEGAALPGLIQLARQEGVRLDCVGSIFGTQRNQLLAEADIGIGNLGLDRAETVKDSSLKHRLYAAAGLPFITTNADPSWRAQQGVLQVDIYNDHLPPQPIVAFVHRLLEEYGDSALLLRRKAEILTWNNTYAHLWDYLRSTNLLED